MTKSILDKTKKINSESPVILICHFRQAITVYTETVQDRVPSIKAYELAHPYDQGSRWQKKPVKGKTASAMFLEIDAAKRQTTSQEIYQITPGQLATFETTFFALYVSVRGAGSRACLNRALAEALIGLPEENDVASTLSVSP